MIGIHNKKPPANGFPSRRNVSAGAGTRQLPLNQLGKKFTSS